MESVGVKVKKCLMENEILTWTSKYFKALSYKAFSECLHKVEDLQRTVFSNEDLKEHTLKKISFWHKLELTATLTSSPTAPRYVQGTREVGIEGGK